MNILVTLECSDTALNRSRTVCAKYLPQIGSKTFSGILSESGLSALIDGLKAVTSKNSSIHIHKTDRNGSTLIKTMGSTTNFDEGSIAYRYVTPFDPLKGESHQLTILMTAISALLHDIGKSSFGFQFTLNAATNMVEPAKDAKPAKAVVRHELYSALLCRHAFNHVISKKCTHWSEALYDAAGIREAFEYAANTVNTNLANKGFSELLNDLSNFFSSNNKETPEVLKVITWLVLTHHKLPTKKASSSNGSGRRAERALKMGVPDNTLTFEQFHAVNALSPEMKDEVTEYLTLNQPLCLWRSKRKNRWIEALSDAAKLMTVVDSPSFTNEHLWSLGELYCRPALVFADYYGSSQKDECAEGDNLTTLYANTIRVDSQYVYADTLEEHTLKVLRETTRYCAMLKHREFEGALRLNKNKRDAVLNKCLNSYDSTPQKFKWQPEAVSAIKDMGKDDTPSIVFISADTGHGKTIGAISIALALSEQPRVTVALGRRGLSKQTYNEYCSSLDLGKYTSLLIGGETIAADERIDAGGDEASTESNKEPMHSLSGSDNEIHEHEIETVRVKTASGAGGFSLKSPINALIRNQKEEVMIASAISVMTIDHLTGATNLSKSGNLTNIIRPITSDLILDEIDDYSLEQFGAITWLVMLHAAYGRNVLISSATLTPQLADLLYCAFQQGIKTFNALKGIKGSGRCLVVTGESGHHKVVAAPESGVFALGDFEKTFKELFSAATPPAKSECYKFAIADIGQVRSRPKQGIFDVSSLLIDNIKNLHADNKMLVAGKGVSFGAVKLNKTRDVVNLSKLIANQESPANLNIKVVCYHSRFDNLSKDAIEKWMATYLNRKGIESQNDQKLKALLNCPHIERGFNECTAEQDLCVVFVCTNIIEVGRDVDFDWGIHEPLSMQSIIQFKGRINRHRNRHVTKPNVVMLSHTISEIEGGKFSHFGVGGSTIGSPRDTDKILALANRISKAAPRLKEDVAMGTAALSQELVSRETLATIDKWFLNSQTLKTDSTLAFADAALLVEKILLGTTKEVSSHSAGGSAAGTNSGKFSGAIKRTLNLPALSSLTNEPQKAAMTRNWYIDNPLRERSDEITIFEDCERALKTTNWNFLKKRGIAARTPFRIILENTVGDNWLFDGIVGDDARNDTSNVGKTLAGRLKAHLNTPAAHTTGDGKIKNLLKINVRATTFRKTDTITLCARTGLGI